MIQKRGSMTDDIVDVKAKTLQTEQATSIGNQVMTMSRRLQLLESKQDNLRGKTLIVESNLINFSNDAKSDLNIMSNDISAMKNELREIKNTLNLVIEELKLRAKATDLKVLEKYIEYFSPLKYTTEDDVKKIIHEFTAEKENIKKEGDDYGGYSS